MKKLLIILVMLIPFWVLAQNRPLVNADLLDWFDSEYFLDTLDFDVTKTWYVDTDYDGTCWSCPVSNGTILAPYTTISAALLVAQPTDLIYVFPGSYTEHLTFTEDSVVLLSRGGPDVTFLEATSTGAHGINVADYTWIEGFTITGDAAGTIFELANNETNVTIINNIINTTGSNTFGIVGGAAGSDSLHILNNIFYTNSGDGAIWLEKTNTNTVIDGNVFYGQDSTIGYAIQTAGIDGARFTNNYIKGMASGIFVHTATSGTSGSYNVLIENNTIKNCSKAIRLGHNTQTVDMDSMFVFNNTLYYNSFAIFIADDANVLSGTFEITGNIIADNTVAIRNAGTVPTYLANLIDGHYVAGAVPTDGNHLGNKDYIDALVTAQDLDFAGDAGTGSVDLDSETFTLAGTANEIETSAGSQTITIGLPDAVTINTLTLTNQSTESTYDIINNSELQNSLVGSYYNFTTDDYIEVADDDNLDFGTGDFSQTIRFRTNTVSGTQYLVNKEAGGVGYGIYITDDDILIRFDDNNADASGIILTAKVVVDTWYILSIAFDRDGNATANLNGTITGTVDISGTNLTLSNAGNYRLGSTTAGADFFDGYIDFNLVWNRLLTSSEMEIISKWSSDNPPVWFSDVGATQTPIYTSDFSGGVDTWAATNGTVDGNIDGIGGQDNNLRYYADATSAPHNTEINLTSQAIIGKLYRITLDYYLPSGQTSVDGFDLLVFSNEQGIIHTTTDSWTSIIYDIPVPYPAVDPYLNIRLYDGVTRTFSGANVDTDDRIYLRNVVITPIGVVGNWNGSGIGHNTWMDASGNDLFATNSGATYTNIPASDIEEARQDGITTDTQILSSSNLVPDGYVLKYVIGTEVAGNTATLDLGTSAGGSQVFSQQVFTASTVTPVAVDFFNLTGSDVTLYINDDGAGTWNSGELDFIFVIQKIR